MTSSNSLAARTYIVGVVVTNESNIASYFPVGENLDGSNADICSDVAGPSSSGSEVCLTLDLALDPIYIFYSIFYKLYIFY